MNINRFCLIFCVLFSVSTLAAAEGCPYPSAVCYVDGHFQGTGRNAKWESQQMGGLDYVEAFVGAIFIPREPGSRRNGYLEKCMYKTARGSIVALRYGLGEKALTMSLSETTYWQPGNEILGQAVFVCDDRQPDNCVFTVRRPKPLTGAQ